MNLDKWLGIGGHFETGESPEECALRELGEETGIRRADLVDFEYRGLVTFVSDEYGANTCTCSRGACLKASRRP